MIKKDDKRIEYGRLSEQMGADYLLKKGYKIVERNFRCCFGEIDIIAKDKKDIVFIEVKGRKVNSYGFPAEAVNKVKQKKIVKSALYFVKYNGIRSTNLRFDVLSLDADESIEHLTSAFDSDKFYTY